MVKLSRNTVRFIVSLIVVAVAGLMVLQYALLRNTIELRDQTFKRNVYAAMNNALDKLEEIDVRDRVLISGSDSVRRAVDAVVRIPDRIVVVGKVDASPMPPFFFTSTNLTGRIDKNRLYYVLDKSQRVTVRVYNELGEYDTTLVDATVQEGEHSVPIPVNRFASGPFLIQLKCGTSVSTLKWQADKQVMAYTVNSGEAQRKKLLDRVAQTFTITADDISLASRYPAALFDSVISSGLRSQAITIPYEFGIFRNDSLELGRPSSPSPGPAKSEFVVPLTRFRPLQTPEYLRIYFPTYNAYLFSELVLEVGATLLFAAIIIGCFVFAIRTILRQKEFAGRLSDFINNMTHEFKTPISTISLASEAIALPKNSRSLQKVRRYNGMIADENNRMKKQVEKILQMSALEEGDYEFKLAPVDVHPVIVRAVENTTLQMAARKGSITTELSASPSTLRADAVHLENIIHTILDNAIKYSREVPEILVTTATDAGRLVVRIQDHGVGIAAEHQEKVFEKYYRVPTGNVHDVKGFGLGLSYVKLVTEAHRGTVSLHSAPGKGTTVELRFPLQRMEAGRS